MSDTDRQTSIRVGETLDEMGNVLLGSDPNIPAAGNPHYTMSQRIGQMILYGTPDQQSIAKIADAILTFIQVHVFNEPVTQSHCLDSLQGFPKSLPEAG